jgi:lipid II:glycine glycyltransferase (peptidoglycan interpeptide bridge formation enzyme)
MPVLTPGDNNPDLAREYPNAHLLQLPEWAEFKSHFGWQSHIFSSLTARAQVLFRSLPAGYSIAYLPKGPLGTNWSSLWPQIDQECRKRKTVFLQGEPDLILPLSDEVKAQFPQGFIREEHTLQPRRTVSISLEATEEGLLAAMKQKTRYNIRLAAKKGLIVKPTANVRGFYEMMLTTGNRDGFAIHNLDYYQKVFDIFAPSGKCVLLAAFFEETPLAYLMLFLSGSRSWYFYGASDNSQRNLMPTYLLQWEAMRWAKAHGAVEYDLWGIPDAEESELEANFADRSDGLWGVYRFKRGFGGQIVRNSPAFVKIYKPLLYKLYEKIRAGRMAD